jgi:hypothetical protein
MAPPELIRPFGRRKEHDFISTHRGNNPADTQHLSIHHTAANLYTKTTHTLRLFSLCVFYIYRQTSLLINYVRQPRVLSQLGGSCWNFIDLQFEKNARAGPYFPYLLSKADPNTVGGYISPASVDVTRVS